MQEHNLKSLNGQDSEEFQTQAVENSERMATDCLDDEWPQQNIASKRRRSHTAMLSERERLKTFEAWPPALQAKNRNAHRDMAKYGFYYTDKNDRVRCVFCGLEIENWSSEMLENVSLVHWKNARTYCKFLKGENVGNIPLTESWMDPDRHTDDVRFHSTVTPGHVTEQFRSRSVPTPGESDIGNAPLVFISWNDPPASGGCERTTPSKNGVVRSYPPVWAELLQTAQYPHMVTLKARLATFSRWPLVNPRPKDLAKAGFFCVKSRNYRGDIAGADSVRCFWCGERMHKWRSTDDPVLEHARLAPHCKFVRQLLGDDVHRDIVNSLNAENNRISATENPATSQSTGGTELMSEVDEVMNTPAVRAVLEMGFPPQLVKDILAHNSPLLDAETLCSLVLQAAEEQATQASLGNRSQTQRLNYYGQRPSDQSHGHAVQGEGSTSQSQGYLGQGHECTSQGQEYQEQVHARQGHRGQQSRRTVEDLLQEMGRKYALESYSFNPSPSDRHYENTSTNTHTVDKLTCKVCRKNEVKVTFRPCCHLSCCVDCSSKITICPVCHRPFSDKIVTYLA